MSLSLRQFDRMVRMKDDVRERTIDMPAALICSVLANLQRDPEKKAEPFTLYDFLLSGKPAPVEAELDEKEAAAKHNREQIARIRWLNALMGGTEEPGLAAAWDVLA